MKILYVATISNTLEFFPAHINMLLDLGHTVDFACNVINPINTQLLQKGCKVFNIGFQRSPFKKENYKAYVELKKLVQDEGYDLVHTHTPIASAIVRLACRNMSTVKVFYTAHGFHFFKGAPLINWLIYYPAERWLARYTDTLITINKEDYARAKKSFKAGKVEYIPGVGIDTKKFADVIVDKVAKRQEIGIPKDAFILLSVGELNRNKNHEVIIKAIAKLNNPKVHYMICGKGQLLDYLISLADDLNIKDKIHLVGYRKDILEICKTSDVFVFPSYREGLPVSLMEAMACGLPLICSNIRGNSDLIENEVGGYLVSPNDDKKIVKYISFLIENNQQKEQFGKNNYLKIKGYSIENVLESLKRIYP